MVLRVDRRLLVSPDLGRASAALDRHLAAVARAAVAGRGRFSLVISGGRTPAELYRRWGAARGRTLPWASTELFFADERCVPPRHPDSNFGAAWDAFLSRVPIPRARVHRMRGELSSPSEAAARYARALGPVGRSGTAGRTRFDVVLLGIGSDGHTASLFPRSPAVREEHRAVVAVARPGLAPFVPRVTLTPPALSSAREVCFLVAGADKSEALSAIFRSTGEGDPRLPPTWVRPFGPVLWFVDRAAARGLAGARVRPAGR